MDRIWLNAVKIERELDLPMPLPDGLTMEEESLVKPSGRIDDPQLVISTYPTKNPKSTVHLRYGVVNDLSNLSMFNLCAELGFHMPGIRSSGMLRLDVFPEASGSVTHEGQ